MNQTLVPGTKLTSLVSDQILDKGLANCYCLKYLMIDIYELKILASQHDVNQEKQLRHASWASLFAIGGTVPILNIVTLQKRDSKDGNSRSFRGRITSISDYVSADYM